jgi:predicted dinucleotide-binding enzyme
MCPTLHRGAVALLAVVQRDRTRGRAQRIARELKTERVVHVFEAIFAEARNDRRVAVR